MTTSALALIKKLLVLFLLIGGLYIAKAFLIPLSIAGVVATLFLPFCKWMESKKLYRGFATSICLLVILLFIGGLFFLVGWQVSALASDFVLIKQRALETSANIQDYIFNHFGITLEKQSQLLETQQANAGDIIPIMAGSMASGFINFFLTLVYIFGLLYYRAHIKKFLLMLAQPSQRDEVEKVIYRVANVSQQYLFGLSKMIVCLWIMYSIGFSILGVKKCFLFCNTLWFAGNCSIHRKYYWHNDYSFSVSSSGCKLTNNSRYNYYVWYRSIYSRMGIRAINCRITS
ncbi:MAG: AI-2E family transporter [Saprospiraceae bacterium]|uniref:AI-2E family transporter n=1 Tax=Candidatus Defluviibacterium haderslevense TaxID=2981993 RepID=A0A9D7XEU0_9BACT|nr:AI-2E family transporter [Candidatus Defluviibacterium haderslevense]